RSEPDLIEPDPARPGAPDARPAKRRDLAEPGAAGPRRERKRRSRGEHAVDTQVFAEHAPCVASPGQGMPTAGAPVDGLGGKSFDRSLEQRVSEPKLPAQELSRGGGPGCARGGIGHPDHGRGACGAASPSAGRTAGNPKAVKGGGARKFVTAAIDPPSSLTSWIA